MYLFIDSLTNTATECFCFPVKTDVRDKKYVIAMNEALVSAIFEH